MGLFSGEIIFGGAFYGREFCVSKWVQLDNKNSLRDVDNSLKQLKTANPNSPWAYIWEGLLSKGYLHLRFEVLIFRREIFIKILRYLNQMIANCLWTAVVLVLLLEHKNFGISA